MSGFEDFSHERVKVHSEARTGVALAAWLSSDALVGDTELPAQESIHARGAGWTDLIVRQYLEQGRQWIERKVHCRRDGSPR
jgi:hypothetical protein